MTAALFLDIPYVLHKEKEETKEPIKSDITISPSLKVCIKAFGQISTQKIQKIKAKVVELNAEKEKWESKFDKKLCFIGTVMFLAGTAIGGGINSCCCYSPCWSWSFSPWGGFLLCSVSEDMVKQQNEYEKISTIGKQIKALNDKETFYKNFDKKEFCLYAASLYLSQLKTTKLLSIKTFMKDPKLPSQVDTLSRLAKEKSPLYTQAHEILYSELKDMDKK